MTGHQDLRDKIARVMYDEFNGLVPDAWEREDLHERSYWLTQADAVLAVIDLDAVRAEALRDLARVLQEALPESPSAAQTDRMKFAIGFLNASAADPYERTAEQ